MSLFRQISAYPLYLITITRSTITLVICTIIKFPFHLVDICSVKAHH